MRRQRESRRKGERRRSGTKRNKTGSIAGDGKERTKRRRNSGFQRCQQMLVCLCASVRDILTHTSTLQMSTSIPRKPLVLRGRNEWRKTSDSGNKMIPQRRRKAKALSKASERRRSNERLRRHGSARRAWADSIENWRARKSFAASSARSVYSLLMCV